MGISLLNSTFFILKVVAIVIVIQISIVSFMFLPVLNPIFDKNTYAKSVEEVLNRISYDTVSDETKIGETALNLISKDIASYGLKHSQEIIDTWIICAAFNIGFVPKGAVGTIVTKMQNMISAGEGKRPSYYQKPISVKNVTKVDESTGNKIQLSANYVDNESTTTIIYSPPWRTYWATGKNDTTIGTYVSLGYNVLIIDPRTQGGSQGQYISFGYNEAQDLHTWIYDYAAENPEKNVILVGESMGAATVLGTLNYELPTNIQAVISDCSFVSLLQELRYIVELIRNKMHDALTSSTTVNQAIKDSLMQYLNDDKIDYLTKVEMKDYISHKIKMDVTKELPISGVKYSKLPKLFIHGDSDQIVPPRDALVLYEAASGYKELYISHGNVDHVETSYKDPHKYKRTVREFVKTVLDN